MAERELQLELTEEARDLLVDKGWDPAMGARPLRRAIQRYIEDPLADFVLRAQLETGSTVMVDAVEQTEEGGADDGADPIKLSIIEPKKVPAAVWGGRRRDRPGATTRRPEDDAPPPGLPRTE
jgi:ATP-dependent Clp protease ATP-binding subunit ClpC